MAAEPTGFRRWRRTRPFWGAVFAVLAGLELIAIPLAPLALSIHQGMPGVASWLCGALLILCGLLTLTQPQQRSFFGVLAVLAALGSFVTSNLGGFLLGLLLGLVGGGLIFAWSPKVEKTPEQLIDLGESGDSDERERPELEVPQSFGNQLEPAKSDDELEPAKSADKQLEPAKSGRAGKHRGMKALAVGGVLPAAVGLHMNATPTPQPTPTPSTTAQPAALSTPAPSASPSPAPSATPSQSASPSPSPSPSASPSASATPSGTSTPPKAVSGTGSTTCPTIPSASSGITQDQARTLLQALVAAPATCLAQLSTPAPSARSDAGFEASAQPATLKASALWMYGMTYDGVVGLPTAQGTVQVLKFSMSKASLDGVDQSIGSGSAGLTTPNLVFDNGVVMYTTKLTGSLLGIPVTLQPGSPLLPVLQALNLLHLPVVELSNVVSEQPAVATGSATASQLGIKG